MVFRCWGGRKTCKLALQLCLDRTQPWWMVNRPAEQLFVYGVCPQNPEGVTPRKGSIPSSGTVLRSRLAPEHELRHGRLPRLPCVP